jgi:hypothetical protein
MIGGLIAYLKKKKTSGLSMNNKTRNSQLAHGTRKGGGNTQLATRNPPKAVATRNS